MFLITEPIWGIPLYELHARLTWSPREILARLIKPGYWEEERYRIDQMKKQYREIKELAKLLSVPIIRIPAPRNYLYPSNMSLRLF